MQSLDWHFPNWRKQVLLRSGDFLDDSVSMKIGDSIDRQVGREAPLRLPASGGRSDRCDALDEIFVRVLSLLVIENCQAHFDLVSQSFL
jgi:hypothetical protein